METFITAGVLVHQVVKWLHPLQVCTVPPWNNIWGRLGVGASYNPKFQDGDVCYKGMGLASCNNALGYWHYPGMPGCNWWMDRWPGLGTAPGCPWRCWRRSWLPTIPSGSGRNNSAANSFFHPHSFCYLLFFVTVNKNSIICIQGTTMIWCMVPNVGIPGNRCSLRPPPPPPHVTSPFTGPTPPATAPRHPGLSDT